MGRHVLEEKAALAAQPPHPFAEGVIGLSSAPPAAEADIECSGSAVMGRGLLEAEDEGPQVRQAEPVRNHPPQHAALREGRTLGPRPALAGDHQHDRASLPLRPVEEADQGAMGLVLAHAVQVDDAVDGANAAP